MNSSQDLLISGGDSSGERVLLGYQPRNSSSSSSSSNNGVVHKGGPGASRVEMESSSSTTSCISTSCPILFFGSTTAKTTGSISQEKICSIGTSSSSSSTSNTSNTTGIIGHLGSGYCGHAFSVAMECEQELQQQSNNRDTTNHTTGQTETIVIKLMSAPATAVEGDQNRNKAGGSSKSEEDQRPLGKYKSEDIARQQENRMLYDRLLSSTKSSSTEKALQHFGIQLGVVGIPHRFLNDAVLVANRSMTHRTRYRGMVIQEHNNSHNGNNSPDGNNSNAMLIQGKVYAYNDGKSLAAYLGRQNQLQQEGRRHKVVQDLIYMYRHMYERGVLHCDVKLEHFMYSPSTNVTTLIDFDEHKLLPLMDDNNNIQNKTRSHHVRQMKQQWQLLVIIANVCDYKEQQRQQKRHPRKLGPNTMTVCGERGADILFYPQKTFASIFDECNFEYRPMDWSDDMFDRTSETYEALAAWSGLSSERRREEKVTSTQHIKHNSREA